MRSSSEASWSVRSCEEGRSSLPASSTFRPALEGARLTRVGMFGDLTQYLSNHGIPQEAIQATFKEVSQILRQLSYRARPRR